MCSGIWHQNLSRSFRSDKLSGMALKEGLVCPLSHRCLIKLRKLKAKTKFFHVSYTIPEYFLLPGRAHYSADKSHCHKLKLFPGRLYLKYINMNARAQGFLAEHCPEHHSASAGIPFPHIASWCNLFPR